MPYSNYETSKLVTISSGHISPETKTIWEDIISDQGYVSYADANMIIYDKDGFGYFVYITEKNTSKDYSKDINDLMIFAKETNADIICLDSDGPVVKELPYYENDRG